VGRGAYIGPGVVVGDRCTIENHALVYEPAAIEDGAFIGPAVVFTNDYYPRAVTPDGEVRTGEHWQAIGVTVREGASIGARAVCVAPVTIGRWALVAAGSVVTRDVPDFALVAGAPARRVRWVGPAGVPLHKLGGDRFRCPVTARQFVESAGVLREEPEPT
jgi:acetyltransferase-like isoleucine patch superfamily enzyme